ncbi:TSUP family transporter [Halomonas sp. HAL1]|uniref:TSUP family transporter n=1 Tax=Halomonas sp. HAL1 TaxID=550984 RepID=UPI0034A3A943
MTIFLYLLLRLFKQESYLQYDLAKKLVIPVGLCGGLLQGAVGMSGPVSVAFLNFMRLERTTFIGSISTFFTAITVVQLPMLISLDIVTWPLIMASFAAYSVISLAMPYGGEIGQKMSRHWFDKIVMLLLLIIAIQILIESFIS